MYGRALLSPSACWRSWASRCKWPNPQLLLQQQSPPITLLPHHPPPITSGTHATRGNGHTIHTPWTPGGGLGDALATRRTECEKGQVVPLSGK